MKIAIRGHQTREKEVARILESLGGKNRANHSFTYNDLIYYLDSDNLIICALVPPFGYREYTLEEFEKEFPFKVGDKVTVTGTKHPKIITGIADTQWGPRYVISEIKFPDSKEMPHISQISLYKEMKEERNITLTLDKAKEWYQNGRELREVALQAYSEEELNSLPISWKEFCKRYPKTEKEAYIGVMSTIYSFAGTNCNRDVYTDRNICPSQKSAEAHLAMIQLEQLRNCWWNGWEPEWNSCAKCAIKNSGDGLCVITSYNISAFLVFPTREMAEEFLNCFKDLIEKAGDLI